MRPATPLSVLFFAAFALLLLASLSTPVIKGIPLATSGGVTFGVWGFCKGKTCSTIGVGYSTDSLNQVSDNDFSLPNGLRHTVSFILIAHPVAAFMGLVCLALALSAHFHSPSHSPRYLLGLFTWTIPTILASMLAFLIDLLLFVPHNSWGSWIVLAATIILFISSVITCFMRRTLVSRKARRKRIAENAEMSGQNYNENRAAEIASLPKAESPPPLSGGSISPLNPEKPAFAAFESQVPGDRIPLGQNNAFQRSIARDGSPSAGYGPRPMPPPNRDQYGNPLPPHMGRGGPLRQQPSNTSLQSNPSNRSNPGPPPLLPPIYAGRGRGGYRPPGAPGRGGYPPRGGMMRGGMPPQGMRGPPQPGYGSRGRGGPPGMMRRGAPPNMIGRGGPPPPNYGADTYYNGPPPRQMPTPTNQGSVGQAVEMDATNGMPSPAQSRPGSSGPGASELPGYVGATERRPSQPARAMSPTSEYSRTQSPELYVPPRAQWAQPPQQMTETPPLRNYRALSPIEASPTSLPRANGNGPSNGYVEDVDPAFAAPARPLPASLVPGGPLNTYGQSASGSNLPGPNLAVPISNPTMTKFLKPTETTLADPHNPSISQLQYSNSNESLPDGQRSPAASDVSHFTSVSQRGVNPNWRPSPGQEGRSDPRQQQNDVLLDSNPDFALHGAGPGRGGRGGYGGGGGGISIAPPRGGIGLGPASAGGRYPGAL